MAVVRIRLCLNSLAESQGIGANPQGFWFHVIKKQANVMPIMDVRLHILNSYRKHTCQTFKRFTSLFQLP